MTTIQTNSIQPPQSLPDPRATPPAGEGSKPASTAGTARVSTPQDVPAPATDQAATRQPSARELSRLTEELQRRVSAVAPELQFSVDETSGRSIVKVTDRTTNELIRQIPSEEILDLNKALDRFQQGLLVNGKA